MAIPAGFSLASITGRSIEPIAYGDATRETRPQVTLSLLQALAPGQLLALLLDGTVVRTLTTGSTLTYQERRLDEGVHAYVARIMDPSGIVTPLDLNGTLPGTDYVFRVL